MLKKVTEFFKKHNVIIAIVLVLFLVLGYTTYTYLVPFKSYGDIWAHIASVEELKKPFNQIGDPYFESGPKDPHYGPYFVLIAQISNLLSIDHILVMSFLGVLSVVALYLASIFAYNSFLPHRRNFKIDKLVLFIAIFLMWDSGRISYAGYFSLADAAITIQFPHMFALALFMIGMGLIVRLFEEQFKLNRFTLSMIVKYVLVGIMAAGIFLTHVLTGVIFFFSYACIGLYYFLFKYKFKINLLFASNIVSLIVAVIVASFWPYYDILSPFKDLQTVHTEQPLVAIFEISTWLTVAGVAFLGLIASVKTKSKILVFWMLLLLFITASYLYPVRISSYWRFFPMMLIPLYFLITEWISSQRNLLRTLILFMLIIFGVNSFVNKVNTIGFRDPINPSGFNFLTFIPKDKLIFSDPETSYFLSGLTGNPVLAVNNTHWNPANVVAAQERYDDSLSFWLGDASSKTLGHAIYAIEKYNIEFVLINKRIYKNYQSYAKDLGNKYRVSELYQDSSYLLLYLNK